MTITVTFEGKPFGSPMNDLKEDDLLWFIRSQMELGREVHISPDPEDLFHPDCMTR